MIKPRKDQIKMSIKPPSQADEKEAAALEFIGAAPGGSAEPQSFQAPPEEEIFPWERSGVREDVVKQYNLRLPEPDLLKLRYVVEKQRAKSINSYILNVLLPQLDADVAELTGSKE
ncbi:MAG: hypothetical protein PHS86_00795 [Syntrophaceae bacterium]|nr:hypothetical protein [Syntrophaceae bacterium]